MPTDEMSQLDGGIGREIAKKEKIRDKLLASAEKVQVEIDGLRARQVIAVRDRLASMGMKVTVQRPPSQKKTPRCSVCIGHGFSGEGHTAAKHHLLVVRGEIPDPKDKQTPNVDVMKTE